MAMNFNKYPDRNMDPAPRGWHFFRVLSAEPEKTKAGDPMLKLMLQVVDGEHKGKVAFDNLVSSKKGEWIARIKLRILGMQDHEIDEFDPDDLLGLGAWICVEPRDYEGKTYMQPSGDKDSNFGYSATAPTDLSAPEPQVPETPF